MQYEEKTILQTMLKDLIDKILIINSFIKKHVYKKIFVCLNKTSECNLKKKKYRKK